MANSVAATLSAGGEAQMIVRLITNPTSDAHFRDKAEGILADGADSPIGLQARLREDYPSASVVRGIEEQGAERWYAYRDGRWIDSARDSRKADQKPPPGASAISSQG
jgi:hypothetical protein